jgi:hypothetical protein
MSSSLMWQPWYSVDFILENRCLPIVNWLCSSSMRFLKSLEDMWNLAETRTSSAAGWVWPLWPCGSSMIPFTLKGEIISLKGQSHKIGCVWYFASKYLLQLPYSYPKVSKNINLNLSRYFSKSWSPGVAPPPTRESAPLTWPSRLLDRSDGFYSIFLIYICGTKGTWTWTKRN